MKKLIALILSSVMILSVCLFASCEDNKIENTTTASTTATESTPLENTTTSTEHSENTSASSTSENENPPEDLTTGNVHEETTASSDDPIDPGPNLNDFDGYTKLPGYENIDFGGRTFLIAVSEGIEGGGDCYRDVYSDATDAISTSVRHRNQVVENLYNCVIDWDFSTSPGTKAMAEVTSNAHTIDLYSAMYSSSGIYTNDNNYNLYSLGIDFTNDWWDQGYVNTYTVNKNGSPAMYAAIGDFALSSFWSTYTLFYNKEVYNQSKVCQKYDIYQLVRDNKWTMDIFTEMVKDAKHDANGNSVYSYEEGDVLGWIRTSHASHAMHVASGLSIITNENGKFVFSPEGDPTAWVPIIDKAIDVWATEGSESIGYTSVQKAIEGDKALFASEVLDVLERMRNSDVSVGLVPYPLYNESQENYYHYVDNHVSTYSIPISVPDPENVATFFELFACHSKYIVRTAFVDTYAVEYCSDDDSREMLDIVISSRSYDPGYLWWSAYETDLSNFIQGGRNNVTSWTTAKSKMIHSSIEDFEKGLNDNKN